MSDIGIRDKFIKEVGSTIEPGHSALSLVVVSSTQDRVVDETQEYGAKVLQTSLSKEVEAKLKEAGEQRPVPRSTFPSIMLHRIQLGAGPSHSLDGGANHSAG